jgi:hypothetical protein
LYFFLYPCSGLTSGGSGGSGATILFVFCNKILLNINKLVDILEESIICGASASGNGVVIAAASASGNGVVVATAAATGVAATGVGAIGGAPANGATIIFVFGNKILLKINKLVDILEESIICGAGASGNGVIVATAATGVAAATTTGVGATGDVSAATGDVTVGAIGGAPANGATIIFVFGNKILLKINKLVDILEESIICGASASGNGVVVATAATAAAAAATATAATAGVAAATATSVAAAGVATGGVTVGAIGGAPANGATIIFVFGNKILLKINKLVDILEESIICGASATGNGVVVAGAATGVAATGVGVSGNGATGVAAATGGAATGDVTVGAIGGAPANGATIIFVFGNKILLKINKLVDILEVSFTSYGVGVILGI